VPTSHSKIVREAFRVLPPEPHPSCFTSSSASFKAARAPRFAGRACRTRRRFGRLLVSHVSSVARRANLTSPPRSLHSDRSPEDVVCCWVGFLGLASREGKEVHEEPVEVSR